MLPITVAYPVASKARSAHTPGVKQGVVLVIQALNESAHEVRVVTKMGKGLWTERIG